MSRSNLSCLSCLAFAVLLAAAAVPIATLAQSQDSQSVAEAARRAREKKKTAATKPVKVITDETLDVKKGDVQSATAEEPKMPGSQNVAGAAAAPAANPAASSAAPQGSEKGNLPKEVEALKKQVKDAENDLDLAQREYRLDNEAYYSKPDYANDPAGKQKLDDEKQRISDKQQELERLKAKLADLQQAAGTPPPPPQP